MPDLGYHLPDQAPALSLPACWDPCLPSPPQPIWPVPSVWSSPNTHMHTSYPVPPRGNAPSHPARGWLISSSLVKREWVSVLHCCLLAPGTLVSELCPSEVLVLPPAALLVLFLLSSHCCLLTPESCTALKTCSLPCQWC